MRLTVCLLLVCLFVPSAVFAQSALCEPSPEVRLAIRNLPDSTGDSQADRAATLAALRALIKRFPDNVWAHHRYQDEAMNPTDKDRDSVIAEYAALAAKHPGNAVYAYLAARARIGSATKTVLPDLEKLAVAVPAARISLVNIYQSQVFKDNAKVQAHLEAFAAACPASLTQFQYLRSLPPSDFVTKSAVRMRDVLAKRNDIGSLSFYTTLWSLEFRVKPPAEHDALRKQIAEDLKRLRAYPKKDLSFYGVLQQGYKLANDKDGLKWATDQLRASPTRSGFYAERDEWNTAHPYKAADPPGAQKARASALVEASAEWVRRWPNQVSGWFERVSALTDAENAKPEEVEAAGENLLKTHAKDPDALSFFSQIGGNSFSLMVAYLYASKGVRLDRLPELVKDGLHEIEQPRDRGWQSDEYPASSHEETDQMMRWVGRVTVADIWLKTRNAEAARKTLLDLQTRADLFKPKADVKDPKQAERQQQVYLGHQVEYWQRMGDLATLEGHKTDAMAFYQNALLARPAAPASSKKDELAEKARALWADIGGSNEGWQAWFTRRDLIGGAGPKASATLFTAVERKLPDFDLPTLTGAKLRLADFKGRATLVGIWATW